MKERINPQDGTQENQKMDPPDPEAQRQFREEAIARELLKRELTQLSKAKKKILDIDDEKATLASMIVNQTLVPPVNVRTQVPNCTAESCTYLE